MKTAVATEKAPKAIGPYSQAIAVGPLLFLSGQIALDPLKGEVVAGAIEAQTEQVMKNIGAILTSKGLDYSHIVKSTVFLKNMEDFAVFNKVYESFLKAPFPARSTVEVSRLPKDVLVEIEVIAHAN